MRASTSIDLKDRKVLKLTNLRGMDSTTDPINLSTSRAALNENFIMRDGANRKRHGWGEIFRIAGKRINGIIDAKYMDGNNISTEVDGYLVYAEKVFYFVYKASGATTYSFVQLNGTNGNADVISSSYSPSAVQDNRLQDNRVEFYSRNGNIYIIGCGDYLYYGKHGNKYELRRVVNDENTYIPLVTSLGEPLDDVNMLNTFRRERVQFDVVYSGYKQGTSYLTGFAGSTVKAKVYYDDGTEDEGTFGTTAYATDSTLFKYKTLYFPYSTETTANTNVEISIYPSTDGGYQVDTTVYTSSGHKTVESVEIIYDTKGATKYYEAVTKSMWVEQESGNYAYVATITKDSPIKAVVVEELGKNPPNYISETSNVDYAWRTYVVGRTVATDINVNVVFSGNTVQLRTNDIDIASLADNAVLKIGVACETQYADKICNCNFGGLFGADGDTDRLFVSGNADEPSMDWHSESDDFTYFSDLSYTGFGSGAIKGYGRMNDSKQAVFCESVNGEPTVYYRSGTNKESYDDDGELALFVGLFPVKAGTVSQGIVSRNALASYNGECVALTKDGVYGLVLTDNIATEQRLLANRSWGLTTLLRGKDLTDAICTVRDNKYYLGVGNECFVADANYTFAAENGTSYEWWRWTNIPARVFGKTEDFVFGTADGKVCRFNEGFTDEYYLYNSNVVVSEDITGNCFTHSGAMEISEGDGVQFLSSVDDTNGNDLKDMTDLTAYDVKSTSFKVKCRGVLVTLGGTAQSDVNMRVTKATPVTARMTTGVFDMGSHLFDKSILKMSVTAEGKMKIGYTTRVQKLFNLKQSNQFDFSDVDFTFFAFETGIQTAYTFNVLIRNFNYIQFSFEGSENGDCCMEDFAAVYKFNRNSKGVS